MSQSAVGQSPPDDQPSPSDSAVRVITRNDLATMASELFQDMLGMSFDTEPAAATIRAGFDLEAAIDIEGEWRAELRFLVHEALAKRIASAMLLVEADELSHDDTYDALGEAVNVIGGNVKGAVNKDCTLSLPRVSTRIGEIVQDATVLTFDCDHHPVSMVFVAE